MQLQGSFLEQRNCTSASTNSTKQFLAIVQNISSDSQSTQSAGFTFGTCELNWIKSEHWWITILTMEESQWFMIHVVSVFPRQPVFGTQFPCRIWLLWRRLRLNHHHNISQCRIKNPHHSFCSLFIYFSLFFYLFACCVRWAGLFLLRFTNLVPHSEENCLHDFLTREGLNSKWLSFAACWNLLNLHSPFQSLRCHVSCQPSVTCREEGK